MLDWRLDVLDNDPRSSTKRPDELQIGTKTILTGIVRQYCKKRRDS
jgi:hypothetical protein